MKIEFRNRAFVCICAFVVFLAAFLVACQSTPKKTDGSPAEEKDDEKAPLYYDFNDVLVPRELKLDAKSSFVYHTTGFTAGVLVYKARLELSSLIEFFEKNMTKDNWQVAGTFKSLRTLLLFQKENRWCVINITDTNYGTQVEIWVAPISHLPDTGLLK